MQTIEHNLTDGVFVKRRQISLKDADPLAFVPHGDRLLVEVLDLDETTESGITLVRTDDKGKEHEVGWSAGVIINVGSGHRLDTPDQAVVLKSSKNEVSPATGIVAADDDSGEAVFMAPSTVRMPFTRGMVVMVAKYAGSDILLRGMPFKVVTQAHILGVFAAMKLDVEGYYAASSDS